MNPIALGIDIFRDSRWKKHKGSRLGLLSNQASVDSSLHSSCDVIEKVLPGHLKALFGPQHGYQGEDQDNMVETGHGWHSGLGIPVYSLYAEKREPLPEMLESLDVLIVDLQDVGTRVYTFVSTLLNCMRALSGSSRRVIVLDRPNPIGGEAVEGNLLREGLFSFVGPYRLPMRHGMTLGEISLLLKEAFQLDLDLEVIAMRGWERRMHWPDIGLAWVMPSPNMPVYDTALVYPGQVLWEGTNVSEGRGTCRPFEIFGAPYMDPGKVLEALPEEALAGVYMRPYSFKPTFHKWEGLVCKGFMIHVKDKSVFQPYFLSVCLLSAVLSEHRDAFEWRRDPYEYEYDKPAIDLILGDRDMRRSLEQGAVPGGLRDNWRREEAEFRGTREPYLLYHS